MKRFASALNPRTLDDLSSVSIDAWEFLSSPSPDRAHEFNALKQVFDRLTGSDRLSLVAT
jgi:hypothetical protein